jgi:universal stress protein A
MTIQRRRQRWTDDYRRILCPTDFSSLADEGVDRAACLAARGRAELVLVHVLPPASAYAVPEVAGSVLVRFADQWREDAWRALCHIRDRIRQTGVVTHAIICEGYPPEQIARVAGRLRCDLIVLATRGRTGLFRRLLSSSVAEGVMRRAPCPILAYRSPRFSPTQRRVKHPLKIAA